MPVLYICRGDVELCPAAAQFRIVARRSALLTSVKSCDRWFNNFTLLINKLCRHLDDRFNNYWPYSPREGEQMMMMDEVERNIVTCQWRKDQLFGYWIIDLRDIDKSRCFAIIEFKNCFIIPSPSLLPYLSHSLTFMGSELPFFSQKNVVTIRHEQTDCLKQNAFTRFYS